MNYGLIHSVWTVLLFVLFIGIIVWAWSAKRKRGFDEAARLPFEDEDSHLLPLSPRGRGQGERGEPLIPTGSCRGAQTSCAPVQRRECPPDIRDNPASPPSRGEGSEPSALRATSFTRGGKKHV